MESTELSATAKMSHYTPSYKHITSILSSTYARREINRLRCIQRDFQSAKNIFQWRNALCQAVICNIINNPPKIHLTFTLSNVRRHRLYRICFVWHNIQKTAHEKKKKILFQVSKKCSQNPGKICRMYCICIYSVYVFVCLSHACRILPNIHLRYLAMSTKL